MKKKFSKINFNRTEKVVFRFELVKWLENDLLHQRNSLIFLICIKYSFDLQNNLNIKIFELIRLEYYQIY